jgi:hypothetical protein
MNASLVQFTKRDQSILAQISEFLESERLGRELALFSLANSRFHLKQKGRNV